MKPVKIFLFFLCLLMLISVLAYFFPENGIRFTRELKLNFPTLQEIIQQPESEYKDISEIVENNLPIDTISPKLDTLSNDTIAQKQDTSDKKEIEEQPTQDTLTKKAQQKTKVDYERKNIQYPNNDQTILYPFYKSLTNLKNTDQLVRILHYGDSQIEGDRISSYIRNQLQKRFGGSGIGLFPAVLPFNTHIPLKHKISREWKRLTLKDKSNFKHRRFGMLMSFSRFSPYYSQYQNEVYDAYINIGESPLAYDLISRFSQVRIFYGFNEKPFITKLEYNEKIVDAEMIPATRKLKKIRWTVPKNLNELTISFQGVHSPNIYGIALDDSSGVALDNIPLRGSSGTEFTKTDLTFYKEMLKSLNVKLIIMHFGVNVVPIVRDQYTFYENQFYKQLKSLKALDDDLSIIVMGVTDMSQKSGGTYESYPNIEKIRDAQRSAAFRAGCAFWDTYEAMGGKNSMPSWVFADPPLARKDFTHFTYKGSVVIAKMFYKALMQDYFEYQETQQNEVLSKKDSANE